MRFIPLFIAGAAVLVADNVPYRELTSAERQAVEAAVPSKAAAKPLRARKLLIVHMTRREGKPIGGHPSIPFANYAIELMGKRTGAWTATINNDDSVFRPENLKRYDAVVFNNTVGVLFFDPVLRKSLLDFVRSGKGFVGFHSAAATFVQWPKYDQFPEYGVMLGGYEDGGHPWKYTETTYVKIDEPSHPLVAMLKGEPFTVHDEAFQFRETQLRDHLRVLLTIDVSRMDTGPKRRLLKQRQADMDFPVSWIKTYGKGRVFYTTTGHNPEAFTRTDLLEHYLAAIQFALGDLKADASPSGVKPREVSSR